MRVITNSPVFTEGNSGFEGYSNIEDKMPILKPSSVSSTGAPTSLAGTKSEKKSSKSPSKIATYLSKDSRSERQSTRKTNRLKRKENRKPKKNARKLVVLDAQGTEKTFYPLSPLVFKNGKWYKRKTVTGADGKPSFKWEEVPAKNVLKKKNKKGAVVAMDKSEVEKASGKTLTTAEATAKIAELPAPTNMENKTAIEEAGNSGQGVSVNPDEVTVTGDGNVFLDVDTQDVKEPTKEVSDKPEMTKTNKIILWSVGIVAVGLIGYAVYRSINKNN